MAKTLIEQVVGETANPRIRGSGVQTVYDALKSAIVDLTLEPGAPLDEVTAGGAVRHVAHAGA